VEKTELLTYTSIVLRDGKMETVVHGSDFDRALEEAANLSGQPDTQWFGMTKTTQVVIVKSSEDLRKKIDARKKKKTPYAPPGETW